MDTSKNPQPAQEIRFAVVMYGGVSLAIYIHGVAQELLRLVRSTSAPHEELDPVEQIYQRLSTEVGPIDGGTGACVPTRFVVDILSGTSAGGVNAVFLAKALAVGARDLKDLRQTWLDVADLDKLLNTKGWNQPKRSLLNGGWMYQQLNEALGRVSARSTGCPAAGLERLDLFVTTTDLNGVALPMRLTDMDIVERAHKGCFHFRFDAVSAEDYALDKLKRNDFAASFDPMLAFAARATSSFPVAFAPVKLADIEAVIGSAKYREAKNGFLKFFEWIPAEPLVDVKTPVEPEHRELADGGYLNNKPFDHVIDSLSFRASRLPHSRKLLFVDPFPEVADDEKDKRHFSFTENALDAAMTLPRYQTIRQEIERINELNRTLQRLREIRDRCKPTPRSLWNRPFYELTLDELTSCYGAAYTSYHSVRLFDTTDDLAHIVCSLRETAADDDLFLATRHLVRQWRIHNYDSNRTNGKAAETKFFADFDYSFRLRRAAHLLEWAQTRQQCEGICDSLIRQITRLLRARELFSLNNGDNPLHKEIQAVGKSLTWETIKEILAPVTSPERDKVAGALFIKHAGPLTAFGGVISQAWEQVFRLNHIELQKLRDDHGDFDAECSKFDFLDMITLSFLEGSDVTEHTQTEIYRVSPTDGTKTSPDERVDLSKKLTGYQLADFGAFLNRDYRLNDMLYGRLDGCERIVSAVLNRQSDSALRTRYIEELRRAIVEQELHGGMTALAPVCASPRPVAEALSAHYRLPAPPPPKDSTRQLAQASNILGRMIEDDLNVHSGLSTVLQTGGKIATLLVSFLIPRSLGSLFLRHWIRLIGLAALLLAVLGYLLNLQEFKTAGIYGIIASSLFWLLSWGVGRFFANLPAPRWLREGLRFAGVACLVAIVISGARHVQEDSGKLWKASTERVVAVVRGLLSERPRLISGEMRKNGGDDKLTARDSEAHHTK